MHGWCSKGPWGDMHVLLVSTFGTSSKVVDGINYIGAVLLHQSPPLVRR